MLHLYTQAFVNSWLLSIAQRFLAMEPIIILVGRPLNSSPLSSYTLIYEDLLAVTYTTVALTNDCRQYRPTTTIATLYPLFLCT